ncbi:MAG TPA: oligopeptide/dipeptide ABC transporter ATP-binding protein [Reyranella sp.]|nr:oligopeptide/dipeptide ABC transporter ATP-binding protein [Reyranella sp.]
MSEPLLQAEGLVRHYQIRRGSRLFSHPETLRAVDGVSFTLQPGRTLGLVGESGCGKTTTAKLVLGLLPLTEGEIRLQGETLPQAGSMRWRELRRVMQMVYQDPLAALDRRIAVGRQVMEPLAIHAIGAPAERRDKALAILQSVGLQAHHFDRYPHELSGGQRQRIVLARALILSPRLLVCDEPISALDVSIQAQVVNLLLDLQAEMGLAYLFISHDLRMVRQVSHEVAVMYLGRIVERGDPDRLFAAPSHPYTRALVSAIPVAHRSGRQRLILKGDPPNPVDVPAGCAFHERCPIAVARCRTETPALRPLADGRHVACHLAPGAADA